MRRSIPIVSSKRSNPAGKQVLTTKQRQVKLDKLRVQCRRQNKGTEKLIARLDECLEQEHTRQENFKYVHENLLELQNVSKTLLPKMFDVITETKEEERQNINEVAFEFIEDNRDPNRLINKWENKLMQKKRKADRSKI